MTDNEKELVAQVLALSIAVAEMPGAILGQLVRFGQMRPEEAVSAMRFLAGHYREIARRNAGKPGALDTPILSTVAHRIETVAETVESALRSEGRKPQ